ncbi:MAG: hypothetical protein HF967_05055 [Methanosarcinales archaeon]|nr:hypothetical protein [Methanosarcinales archaeon]
MNLKAIYNSIVKDTRAVSPVVASLILVVVAVVGAATIGVMMGVIGEDVGEQADANQVGDASRAMIELATGKGGWVYLGPVMKDFVEANPGIGLRHHVIKSPQAYNAISMGIADIGVTGSVARSKIAGPLLNKTHHTQFNLAAIREGHTNASTLIANISLPVNKNNMPILRIADEAISDILNDNNHPQFQATWDAQLNKWGVQEVHTSVNIVKLGTIRPMYFITQGNPAPMEQAFIDYVRLKGFAS